MDAASNNSVDDIRSIRDEVNFLPTKAKYRVYIIDEVHMLTTGAFNALLKTLEEPPEHVKFILATTEPQKLPTTILSRCQRFDFKKITNENIVKRLKIICKESDIKIADDALELIAVLSEGAMRDGISILERCCQESTDEIGIDLVKELVGIPSLEYIYQITKAIFENDEIKALSVIDDVINSGKDLNNFLWEVIKYMKDVLVFKASGNLAIYTKEELEEIKNIANVVSRERILNTIYSLSDLENEIKWSSQKTIMFQAGVIKACSSTANDGIEELRRKVEELENKISSGNILVNQTKPVAVANSTKQQLTSQPKVEQVPSAINKEPVKKVSKAAQPVDNNSGNSEVNWANVINSLRTSGKVRLFTSLVNTKVNQQGDMILEIIFPNGLTPFVKGLLEDSANRKDLTDILLQETGKQWHVKLVDGKGGGGSVPTEISKKDSNPMSNLGIDINVIE